jgi:hypothetical protein
MGTASSLNLKYQVVITHHWWLFFLYGDNFKWA